MKHTLTTEGGTCDGVGVEHVPLEPFYLRGQEMRGARLWVSTKGDHLKTSLNELAT
jgi:hypothetical protein